MEVSRLPSDTGVSGWNAITGEMPPPRVLEQPIEADWLIIGAGIAGLAAARRLSQIAPDARIVLLEAVRIGQGPAGRNSGFMIDLPHDLNAGSAGYVGSSASDNRDIRLNRAAIEFARQSAVEYDLDGEIFSQPGKVNAAASEKGLEFNRQYAAHLDSLGEPYQLFDRQQMAELCGSHYYQGGLYTPGTAMLQSAAFVRGCAAGLADKVQIFESTPVLSLERANARWIATTPNGQVSAPAAILTVNGHLESFGYHGGHLMHLMLYASMSRALTEPEKRALGGVVNWGFTPADPMGSSCRRFRYRGEDRLLIRNRCTFRPSMSVDQKFIERFARDHDRSFAERFPMLPEVEMEYRWSGRLCLSRNAVPVFGEIDDRLFAACCQNGLGLAKGTSAGMLAADYAAGQANELVELMVDHDAPQKLPPKSMAWAGATAFIKWQEWRAGKEL